MYVKQLIETEEGTIKFEGELSTEELEVVIQTGLNFLLQHGVQPARSTAMEGPDTEQ